MDGEREGGGGTEGRWKEVRREGAGRNRVREDKGQFVLISTIAKHIYQSCL